MSRLIDADALKQALRNCQIESLIAHTEEKNVFDIINEQPTAYDVEKVVAELEKERMRYFLTIANGSDESMNYAYCKISNAIDTMIDLVRKGGAV